MILVIGDAFEVRPEGVMYMESDTNLVLTMIAV